MNVVFAIIWEVVINDIADVVHIKSPSGDVSGDQDGHPPHAELSQDSFSDCLRLVSVNSVRPDVVASERATEAIHRSLGLGEYQDLNSVPLLFPNVLDNLDSE